MDTSIAKEENKVRETLKEVVNNKNKGEKIKISSYKNSHHKI